MQEEILNLKNQAVAQIMSAQDASEIEQIRIDFLGRNGKLTELLKKIKDVPNQEKAQVGSILNDAKNTIEGLLSNQKNNFKETAREWFDPTIPGIKPSVGHLHLAILIIRMGGVFTRSISLT